MKAHLACLHPLAGDPFPTKSLAKPTRLKALLLLLGFSSAREAQTAAPQTSDYMLITKLAAVLVQQDDSALVLEVVHETAALSRPCLQRLVATISIRIPVMKVDASALLTLPGT